VKKRLGAAGMFDRKGVKVKMGRRWVMGAHVVLEVPQDIGEFTRVAGGLDT
jgi:intergrase/recombinase